MIVEDESRLATQLELLTSRVAAIERRLARLESQEPAARPVEPSGPAAENPLAGLDMRDVGSVVTLLGRTLFVLAGAFLLRALTDSGRLAAGPGVLLGLAFAVTWIVMADVAGGRGRASSAAFHGVAFVLIAFPLIFEATTRFRFLATAAAAAGLGGCTAIALIVGWRRRLYGLAWIATLGGLATACALALHTAELGPFALFLVLLGVAALWLGYVLGWTLLRWPVALAADLAILVLSVRAVTPAAADTPAMAFVAQGVLLVAYLGSFAARTLVLNRDVIPFEVAQSIGAITAGLGGAAYLTHMTRGGGLPLGVATVALGVACYGAAVVFLERRQGRRRNFYFYTTTGLVFVLAGCALAMPSAGVGLVYAVLGVAAAWAGRLSRRVTYRSHGAAYLTAAVVATGLLPHVLYGLGLPLAPDGKASITMLGVLALCGAAMWGLGPEAAPTATAPWRRVPRLIVLVLLLGGLLGAIVGWVLPPLAGPDSAGLVATVRTALLVAGILVLALASRVWAFVEGAWLVYPLLLLTGLKFALEDFRAGRPATLFVGFALYGLALIAGPRLCRRPGAPPPPPPGN
jgi:hypothetical protein